MRLWKPLLAIAALLASCAPREPYALSAADAKRFGPNVARLSVSSRPEPVILGVVDCHVERAQVANGAITGWKTILEADGTYPKFMTACTRQSIRLEHGYAYVFLCRQAIGAGGGCVNGGNYRTADSVRWEKEGVRGTFTRTPFP